jgi:hypothetical protein
MQKFVIKPDESSSTESTSGDEHSPAVLEDIKSSASKGPRPRSFSSKPPPRLRHRDSVTENRREGRKSSSSRNDRISSSDHQPGSSKSLGASSFDQHLQQSGSSTSLEATPSRLPKRENSLEAPVPPIESLRHRTSGHRTSTSSFEARSPRRHGSLKVRVRRVAKESQSKEEASGSTTIKRRASVRERKGGRQSRSSSLDAEKSARRTTEQSLTRPEMRKRRSLDAEESARRSTAKEQDGPERRKRSSSVDAEELARRSPVRKQDGPERRKRSSSVDAEQSARRSAVREQDGPDGRKRSSSNDAEKSARRSTPQGQDGPERRKKSSSIDAERAARRSSAHGQDGPERRKRSSSIDAEKAARRSTNQDQDGPERRKRSSSIDAEKSARRSTTQGQDGPARRKRSSSMDAEKSARQSSAQSQDQTNVRYNSKDAKRRGRREIVTAPKSPGVRQRRRHIATAGTKQVDRNIVEPPLGNSSHSLQSKSPPRSKKSLTKETSISQLIKSPLQSKSKESEAFGAFGVPEDFVLVTSPSQQKTPTDEMKKLPTSGATTESSEDSIEPPPPSNSDSPNVAATANKCTAAANFIQQGGRIVPVGSKPAAKGGGLFFGKGEKRGSADRSLHSSLHNTPKATRRIPSVLNKKDKKKARNAFKTLEESCVFDKSSASLPEVYSGWGNESNISRSGDTKQGEDLFDDFVDVPSPTSGAKGSLLGQSKTKASKDFVETPYEPPKVSLEPELVEEKVEPKEQDYPPDDDESMGSLTNQKGSLLRRSRKKKSKEASKDFVETPYEPPTSFDANFAETPSPAAFEANFAETSTPPPAVFKANFAETSSPGAFEANFAETPIEPSEQEHPSDGDSDDGPANRRGSLLRRSKKKKSKENAKDFVETLYEPPALNTVEAPSESLEKFGSESNSSETQGLDALFAKTSIGNPSTLSEPSMCPPTQNESPFAKPKSKDDSDAANGSSCDHPKDFSTSFNAPAETGGASSFNSKTDGVPKSQVEEEGNVIKFGNLRKLLGAARTKNFAELDDNSILSLPEPTRVTGRTQPAGDRSSFGAIFNEAESVAPSLPSIKGSQRPYRRSNSSDQTSGLASAAIPKEPQEPFLQLALHDFAPDANGSTTNIGIVKHGSDLQDEDEQEGDGLENLPGGDEEDSFESDLKSVESDLAEEDNNEESNDDDDYDQDDEFDEELILGNVGDGDTDDVRVRFVKEGSDSSKKDEQQYLQLAFAHPVNVAMPTDSESKKKGLLSKLSGYKQRPLKQSTTPTSA